MADGDDFVTRSDTDCHKGDMQRRGATGYSARMRRTNDVGKFPLERGHLRTLRDPSRKDGAARGAGFLLVHPRTRDWNQRLYVTHTANHAPLTTNRIGIPVPDDFVAQ